MQQYGYRKTPNRNPNVGGLIEAQERARSLKKRERRRAREEASRQASEDA